MPAAVADGMQAMASVRESGAADVPSASSLGAFLGASRDCFRARAAQIETWWALLGRGYHKAHVVTDMGFFVASQHADSEASARGSHTQNGIVRYSRKRAEEPASHGPVCCGPGSQSGAKYPKILQIISV